MSIHGPGLRLIVEVAAVLIGVAIGITKLALKDLKNFRARRKQRQ